VRTLGNNYICTLETHTHTHVVVVIVDIVVVVVVCDALEFGKRSGVRVTLQRLALAHCTHTCIWWVTPTRCGVCFCARAFLHAQCWLFLLVAAAVLVAAAAATRAWWIFVTHSCVVTMPVRCACALVLGTVCWCWPTLYALEWRRARVLALHYRRMTRSTTTTTTIYVHSRTAQCRQIELD
jgi:hypothetical protein